MLNLSIEEIVFAVEGELISGNSNIEVTSICTDSRNIQEGCLFIPLKGENFDGHDFINESFNKGAGAALSQIDIADSDKCIIKVLNTQTALLMLAKYYRSKFNIPFVAVTGSVGKTSTKEMIASVLETQYNVLKTEGNFNNEIGLPTTLFRLNDSHEIGVVEMGMSSFGEIDRLSKAAMPDTAVITNIGVSHIEKLGNQLNILKAKLEILNGMNDDSNIIINADDELLKSANIPMKNIYYYSINSNEGLYAYNIQEFEDYSTFDIDIESEKYCVEVPAPGRHNIYNSLCAIIVGKIYNVPIDKIIEGIKNYLPGKMRQNIIKLDNNIKIIEDCYNASPQSMRAAISVLAITNGKRKIAVLGDMLELGEHSMKLHRQVGEIAAEYKVDYLFLVGNYSRFIGEGAKTTGIPISSIFYFENNEELGQHLRRFIKSDDVVLIKGSRGMKMESISHAISEVK